MQSPVDHTKESVFILIAMGTGNVSYEAEYVQICPIKEIALDAT